MTTFENKEIQINGKILSRKKLNCYNEIIQTITYLNEKKQKNKNKKKMENNNSYRNWCTSQFVEVRHRQGTFLMERERKEQRKKIVEMIRDM